MCVCVCVCVCVAQVKYILGSFVGGTALLCGAATAGWYYTKYTLGVKDVSPNANKFFIFL